MTRKSLSDILRGNGNFFDGWDDVKAADDFGPVPPSEYVTHLLTSEPFEAKSKGTPGFKLTFKIIEGEYTGRLLWYDIWLTVAAKAQAKRDFAKLGITNPKVQLERPLPQGIRCKCKVALRKADDGEEYNKVKSFAVVGIDKPEVDPFAPDGEEAPVEDTKLPSEADGGGA